MPDIALRLNKDTLIIDGAMGTMLQREGALQEGMCAELLNVMESELVTDIHRRYCQAGAQCITTNSFGGTRHRLAAYGLEDRVHELNRAAVRVARAANPEHILADVGSCGMMLEPLGTASFDEVYEQYYEQIYALASEHPDAILIETMADIADARCALIAAKDATAKILSAEVSDSLSCNDTNNNSDGNEYASKNSTGIPIIVSCTFDSTGHMELSGTDAAACALILEGLGASAVGINCGLGPDLILTLVQQMAQVTDLPIIVQPNAGIPYVDKCGNTAFPVDANEFASYAERFCLAGASLIGSCCGSTPAFTAAIHAAVGGRQAALKPDDVISPRKAGLCVLASSRNYVLLGNGQQVHIIGERINPTGKPQLTAELENGSMSLVREMAEAQAQAGASIIDVNVGAPMVTESEILPKAVASLVGFVGCPLSIDTTDSQALEAALKVYPGRALINSVNGDPKSLNSVLPLAKRYGAAVVALALDETGVPHTLEERLQVLEHIREAAHKYGLDDASLLVDMLTLTAATDAKAPEVTLDAVRHVTAMGIATVLGVSNVSHGLPERPKLNAAFVRAAMSAGLSSAIVNPNTASMSSAIHEHNLSQTKISFKQGQEIWRQAYEECMQTVNAGITISEVANQKTTSASTSTSAQASAHFSTENKTALSDGTDTTNKLRVAILRGDTDSVPGLITAIVAEGLAPELIVDRLLAPTMQSLGDDFAAGRAFLPQMMIAANAMKTAVSVIKEMLPPAKAEDLHGTVVFCTVKGDVHSIGKDICVALLESQDFAVFDLGVDVSPECVLHAALEHNADVICLSALMTTTLANMKLTIDYIYEHAPQYRDDPHKAVLTGGAVVSREWADAAGAGYSDDAPRCVDLVREIVLEGKADK
ncbi:MAG: homocysteine S-methyltransferase family protein [Coriobacteriales bacterium]|jgi:5-methyltetrahydrofolate--homocysteine methyltransferase|nr:homocysteine S-methyltransferase family protein [Coriobacteriales bacterium]